MLCACAASAQQAWTLQDCLDYALKHNIQVQKNRITALATEQSELTIQEQIAQLYVQIMYTKEAKKVNEQLLKTAQSQYDRGVEMMKQGQMARADVVQLEAQLSSAQYSVVNSETQLANYKRQLKALLELDLNTAFDVAGNTPTDEQVLALVPSAQEAYAKAKELLLSHREQLDQLATQLYDKEVLFREDLERIYGPRPWEATNPEPTENVDDNDEPENTEDTNKDFEEL